LTRVLLILPTYSGGGAEKVMRLLAQEFARKGHDVVVIGFYEPAGSMSCEGVLYQGLGGRGFVDGVLKLARCLRQERSAKILSTLKNSGIAVEFAMMLAGTRLQHVVRVANSYSAEFARMPRTRRLVWRMLLKWLHARAAATILVSAGLRDELAMMWDVSKQHHLIIYNPVEEQPPVSPLPEDRQVCIVGRLVEQKNHKFCLDAFSGIRALGHCDVRLLIVGDGVLKVSLQMRAKELGLENAIDFVGWRDDVLQIIAASRALLLTSHFEGFPNVLLEAMNAGVPVVSVDCSFGPSEIITDPVIGELVSVGDLDAYVRALGRVLIAGRTADGDAKRREIAASRYSLREVSQKYEQVLNL
jgi:glycosyltransferase involved in cell wall biosynthesis